MCSIYVASVCVHKIEHGVELKTDSSRRPGSTLLQYQESYCYIKSASNGILRPCDDINLSMRVRLSSLGCFSL